MITSEDITKEDLMTILHEQIHKMINPKNELNERDFIYLRGIIQDIRLINKECNNVVTRP